jgi:hypothetical protein
MEDLRQRECRVETDRLELAEKMAVGTGEMWIGQLPEPERSA